MGKVCFKCGVEKPLSDFYKHPQMADGHVNKCKSCNKRDVKDNRDFKAGYYLKYDRNRPNAKLRSDLCTLRNKEKYRTCKEFRDKALASKDVWRKNNQHKRDAQNAANNAVRDGKIERKSLCEHCGDGGRLQKHHWSYEKEHWLDVVWLCPSCHGKEHKRLNELGRDPDNK